MMLLLNFTSVLSFMLLSSIHTFHLHYLHRSGFSNIYSHHQYRSINRLYNKYIVIYPSCLYSKKIDNIITTDTIVDITFERAIDDTKINNNISSNNQTSIDTNIIDKVIIHHDDNNYIKIQKIINNTLTHQNFTSIYLHSIQFHNDRVEVILALTIHGIYINTIYNTIYNHHLYRITHMHSTAPISPILNPLIISSVQYELSCLSVIITLSITCIITLK